MTSTLARVARRLSQGGARGLGDALKDAGTAGSSGRQLQAAQRPWAVSSQRAQASAASAGEESGSGQPRSGGLNLGLDQVETSTATATAAARSIISSNSSSGRAAAEAAAAGRARPPAGHTDFEQRQLLMLFTCTKCDTRAAKAFSKQSYESGVVIVECPGCDNRHLIADHLGWFGQKGTVEDFAAERGGMVVRKLADGTVELTPEDLLGPALAAEAAAAAGAAAGGGSAAAGAPAGL